jgi:hypothetical protein
LITINAGLELFTPFYVLRTGLAIESMTVMQLREVFFKK